MGGQRYPITCPGCGAKHEIEKSMAQELGLHHLGSAICPDCRMVIHCTYLPESDQMSVEPLNDYVERRKSESSEREVSP